MIIFPSDLNIVPGSRHFDKTAIYYDEKKLEEIKKGGVPSLPLE